MAGLFMYSTLIVFIALSYVTGEDVPMKCDENEYDFDDNNWFCTVSGLMLSHNQNLRIPYSPRSMHVRFMKFYNSRLLYIPYELFHEFENLKSLDVSSTEILDLSRNTFAHANNLTELSLKNNNITEVITSVFVGASLLTRLDLSANSIKKLSNLTFSGLTGLQKVVLSYNELVNIPIDLFVENTYLETIMINNNKLEFVAPEVFKNLRHLREVNLGHNYLLRIHPDIFEAAYTLETVILSSNRLLTFSLTNKSISTQLQINNNQLTTISINGSKFVSAYGNQIRDVHVINGNFLEILDLNNNNITALTNITRIKNLLELNISHNPIGPLNVSTFSNMNSLRALNLRAIGLRKLDFGMFSKQVALESLNLAFNNLTELNLDIFVPYFNNLFKFLVDGNNLTSIQGRHTWSTAFPALQILGISLNKFNCSYLHRLISPPSLGSQVRLNIEPDIRDFEVPHIHDVSCISDVNNSPPETQQESNPMAQIQESLNILQINEARLQSYVLLLIITLTVILIVVIGLIGMRLWQRTHNPTRAYFSNRCGDSITFHSNPTINSLADN